MNLQKPYLPRPTSTALRAFPATVSDLMPAWDEIPEEFREDTSPWCELARRWFFKGLPSTVQFHADEGIDAETAFYHLHCIMGSFEPKHEHKMAAVAYLCSVWFTKVSVEKGEEYAQA